jgi:myo-inositol-1(or 4)-monophosphatase
MNTEDLYKIKNKIHKLVKEIGSYQLKNLGRHDLEIDSKSSAVDLVTEVDKESEKRIIKFIQAHFPDHGILGEESGRSITNKESDYLWIIDPVDGTTNYAHGYPLFSIAIGLQYKEETLFGSVYLPYMDDYFWAIQGEGAYLNNQPIQVSSYKTLDTSIIATGFPYNKKTTEDNNLNYFAKIMPNVGGIRRSGSACIDLVFVASGRTEGYFEMYLNQWDFVPGQLIIREAGGVCMSKPLRDRYAVVAGNPYIIDELIQALREVSDRDYPLGKTE